MSSKEPNPGALRAVTAGIKKSDKRSRGEFDGLYGGLSNDAAIVLADIVADLRQYLLDEKRLTKATLRKFLADTLPRKGFRSVSQRAEDEGVRVALTVLNSIASVVKVRDGQHKLDGRPLSKAEGTLLLLSGRAGIDRHRYMERQRTTAKKGSRIRSETRAHRERCWLEIGTPLRQKHPEWSNSRLATDISRATEHRLNTIRQALPRLGLSKKTDK
jgi:hypothetical protein